MKLVAGLWAALGFWDLRQLPAVSELQQLPPFAAAADGYAASAAASAAAAVPVVAG